MKVCYIKEKEETCDIIKRIILKAKRVFNIIEVDKKGKELFYYLPIYKNNKLSKYRVKKLALKLTKMLEKDGINTIALSKYLQTNELLKNNLYSNNINILDGRFLFKCLIYETIEYILKRKETKMELRRSFHIN